MVILLMLLCLSMQICSLNFSCVFPIMLNSECEEDFKLFKPRTKKQNVTKNRGRIGGLIVGNNPQSVKRTL